MKQTFFAIIMGLGLVVCAERARAQTEDKPLPHAPYLAPVPDYGHWMVTMKYDVHAFDATARADKPQSLHFCGEGHAQVYISRWFESFCSSAVRLSGR